MIYRPSHYATAFRRALTRGVAPEAARKNLIASLTKRGDLHRLPLVVRELERLETEARGGHTVTLEFAREPEPHTVSKLTSAFASHDRVRTRVRPLLVAGVRVTIDDERELDLSFTGKLRTLFH